MQLILNTDFVTCRYSKNSDDMKYFHMMQCCNSEIKNRITMKWINGEHQ